MEGLPHLSTAAASRGQVARRGGWLAAFEEAAHVLAQSFVRRVTGKSEAGDVGVPCHHAQGGSGRGRPEDLILIYGFCLCVFSVPTYAQSIPFAS